MFIFFFNLANFSNLIYTVVCIQHKVKQKFTWKRFTHKAWIWWRTGKLSWWRATRCRERLRSTEHSNVATSSWTEAAGKRSVWSRPACCKLSPGCGPVIIWFPYVKRFTTKTSWKIFVRQRYFDLETTCIYFF